MSETTPLTTGTTSSDFKRSSGFTKDPNYYRVLYHAPLSEKMKLCLTVQGIMNPFSGLFCKAQEVYENSYVQIHENRVEVNVPSPFQFLLCCPPCSEINDYVQVYYFDKRIATQVDRAAPCAPIICPFGLNPSFGGYTPPGVTFPYPCCPSCFDSCGEVAVLHGPMPSPFCCHQFAQVPFLENADEFIAQFNNAKTGFESKYANEQPSQVKMDKPYARDILNTADPNRVQILYRAPLSEKMKTFLKIRGILNPLSGLFCKADDAYENSYVQVQENRVEINMPSHFQCLLCLAPCSEVNDYVQVYYFDKRLTQEVDRAACCSPISCPVGTNPIYGGYVPPAVTFSYPCCPSCFDSCGEVAVLHGKLPCILCCHQFAQVPFLEDAESFIKAVNDARSAYENKPLQAPEVKPMVATDPATAVV